MKKTFSGMPKSGGRVQEDLDETIEAFETVAELCDVTNYLVSIKRHVTFAREHGSANAEGKTILGKDSS